MARINPSPKRVKQEVDYAELIKKHGPALRKLVPTFDKLPKKKQARAAMRKNIQQALPDSFDYTDEGIKAYLLDLAVEDYKDVTTDDLGRTYSRGRINKRAPAGYKRGGRVKMKHGGKACRGRSASSSAEKA